MRRRYKLTLDGIRYDLSEAQYAMLSRRKVKAEDPMTWNFEQRIKSLVKQGLSRKRNGSFERTKLGSVVVNTIHDRLAVKASATSEE